MKLSDLRKYKKILILGYGKEGKVTKVFLKKYFPNAKIGIADKSLSFHYLEEQKNYDLIVRSPGIRKGLVTSHYTTRSESVV